jgi:predicted nucleic acid-binding protein
MTRIYLDACVIIYLVEGRRPFLDLAVRRIEQLRYQGAALLLTSRLSRIECRSQPLGRDNRKLLQLYDAFFGSGDLKVVDASAAVIERATELRALYGFKTPDAIHLATAIESQADVYLTGDVRLATCKDLVVEVLNAERKTP